MTSVHLQSAIDAIMGAGWVTHIEWFSEIDSTNSAARRALRALTSTHSQLPTLFVADRQTEGRGRLQRSWWSPTGCLMFTLALPPSELPEQVSHWSQLALLSGLAVAQTVEKFVEPISVQLKWPNDVYVAGKKIAGVLIESDAKVCLLGIGLNVQVNWTDAPPDVANRAVCITSACKRAVQPSLVLVELIDELHKLVTAWRDGQDGWRTAWQQRCLLTGRVIRVRTADKHEITGYCDGLDTAGRLIVRDIQGVQFLTTGEVLSWQ